MSKRKENAAWDSRQEARVIMLVVGPSVNKNEKTGPRDKGKKSKYGGKSGYQKWSRETKFQVMRKSMFMSWMIFSQSQLSSILVSIISHTRVTTLKAGSMLRRLE